MANNPSSVNANQSNTLAGLAPQTYSEAANAAFAFAYFINQGYSAAQASGIVGNLMQESSVNPESQQPGGAGRGIAQWSVNGRWATLGLSQTQNNASDLVAQLEAINTELNQNYNNSKTLLQAATTTSQAAQVFGTAYEQYGVAGNRVQDAINFFNALPADVQSIGPGQAVNNTSSWFSGIIGEIGKVAANTAGSSGVANVVSEATSVANLASDFANVGTFFTKILSGSFWDQILLFAGGMILFGIGLFGFISTTKTGQTVIKDTAETATVAAAA